MAGHGETVADRPGRATGRLLRRWLRRRDRARTDRDEPLHLGVDVPGCAYGAVTRRAVEEVSRAVERIEAKLNTLLFGVFVTVLIEIWRATHR